LHRKAGTEPRPTKTIFSTNDRAYLLIFPRPLILSHPHERGEPGNPVFSKSLVFESDDGADGRRMSAVGIRETASQFKINSVFEPNGKTSQHTFEFTFPWILSDHGPFHVTEIFNL
jgi:hypothetical protein